MKATDNKVKEFDTVQIFRAIKDKISKEIEGMTFEEFKAYLENKQLKDSPQTSS